MSPVRTTARAAYALAGILAVTATLLLWRTGEVSPTYDESVDDSIVDCYVKTRDLFACDFDITQARFPFYVHAAARLWFPWADGRTVDLGVSAAATLVLLTATFFFARRLLGEKAALLATALLATSPALLAMGRMTLTHSNVLFALLTLLSVIAADAWVRTRSRRKLLAAAALFGMSVGSNLLGSLTVVLFAIMFAPDFRRSFGAREAFAFCATSALAFIASSPVYLMLVNGHETLKAIVEIEESTAAYNYLGLGTHLAPRWYSALLFAVKFGPWWAAFALIGAVRAVSREEDATRRVLLASSGFMLCYLAVKSALFRYDAPHHQAHLLPLASIVAAYGIITVRASSDRVLRAIATMSVGIGFAAQIAAIAVFFPNYLTYGAQYGERFVGEFYGPAVIHCQGLDGMNARVRALLEAGEDVRATTRLCWKFPYRDAPMARFVNRVDAPTARNVFVVSPWNDGRFDASTYGAGLGGLRRMLEAECEPVFATAFPYLPDAYTLFRCTDAAALRGLPQLTLDPVPLPW